VADATLLVANTRIINDHMAASQNGGSFSLDRPMD